MLLSWRDELRVVLAPDQVALVRLGWALTKRGPSRRVEKKIVVPCAPSGDGETPWDEAIQTLEKELPRVLARKSAATVILSNHFVHYTRIPWSDGLSSAAEEEAYARHCFRQVYGAAAEQWDLRLSPEPAGQPQLASAVDKRLLAALRRVFERKGVALASVQPRLMAAFNHCQPSLQGRSGWFLLYEPGILCLALPTAPRHGSSCLPTCRKKAGCMT